MNRNEFYYFDAVTELKSGYVVESVTIKVGVASRLLASLHSWVTKLLWRSPEEKGLKEKKEFVNSLGVKIMNSKEENILLSNKEMKNIIFLLTEKLQHCASLPEEPVWGETGPEVLNNHSFEWLTNAKDQLILALLGKIMFE